MTMPSKKTLAIIFAVVVVIAVIAVIITRKPAANTLNTAESSSPDTTVQSDIVVENTDSEESSDESDTLLTNDSPSQQENPAVEQPTIAEPTPDDEDYSAAQSTIAEPTVDTSPNIVDYSIAHTYQRMKNEIAALESAYPDLITSGSAGKTTFGFDIPIVKLGRGNTEVLIAAGIHAREHITVSFIMRSIEEYAMAASQNQTYSGCDVAALLNSYTIYFVPCINPDGMEIVGGRANAFGYIEQLSSFRGNANCVDINRNFPFLWDEIEADELHYKGESAGSEAETKAMMKLCRAHSFKWMLSVHISGNCIFWIDETNGNVPGDSTLADAISNACGFNEMPCSTDKSSYGGGFENWFRAEFNRPAICVELMSPYTTVTPTGNGNHAKFDSVTSWSRTKKLIAAALMS